MYLFIYLTAFSLVVVMTYDIHVRTQVKPFHLRCLPTFQSSFILYLNVKVFCIGERPPGPESAIEKSLYYGDIDWLKTLFHSWRFI